jgi:hypothetical protein
VARRTNLYQRPRSPLIQGRTRWERPLWQAWLGGGGVALALGCAYLAVGTFNVRGGGTPAIVPVAWVSGIVACVVGSGLGSVAARLLGWRWRWLGAALLGVAGFALALMVLLLMHTPIFHGGG